MNFIGRRLILACEQFVEWKAWVRQPLLLTCAYYQRLKLEQLNDMR